MKKLHYYGTDLNQSGHSFFELRDDQFMRSMIKFGNLPFNPEALPYNSTGKFFPLGTTRFYHAFGFTICAIEGSCTDKRPGSKSIFFVEELVTDAELKSIIVEVPVAKSILDKMPFEVNW